MQGSRDPRRRAHLTETFESSMHEEGSHKFHLDKTLYKGIKYRPIHPGTTTSQRSSTARRTPTRSLTPSPTRRRNWQPSWLTREGGTTR